MKRSEETKKELAQFNVAIHNVLQRMSGKACPICGAKLWVTETQMMYVMHYTLDENGKLNQKYRGEPHVRVGCNICGYTMLFNAQQAAGNPMEEGDVLTEAEIAQQNYAPSMTPAEERVYKKELQSLQEEKDKTQKELAETQKKHKRVAYLQGRFEAAREDYKEIEASTSIPKEKKEAMLDELGKEQDRILDEEEKLTESD
ncbi:hypothetical protein ED328_07570 [Muribaculaceae bacterium Isolate-001 (NCI)]|nr:hypothetical protein ED328_07570 [Muribaculaceae bacterium Isolate-001 (NCI)]